MSPKGVWPGRNWTRQQDEYLRENWGRFSDTAVARAVGRTVVACQIRAKRHLLINRKMNVYTGREVAKIFDVDSHVVSRWIKAGYLKARRAGFRAGRGRVWDVDDLSIERFIRKYPWVYDRRRIHRVDYSYWREMAEAAWARTPFVTAEEAAQLLGCHVETVRRHCRSGWLKAHLANWLGQRRGAWLIPVAELERFRRRRPLISGAAS